MQIKRKQKEPDIVEQRDLSILRFVLFALLPLLLSFIMGFGLGKTKKVNEDNISNSGTAKNDIIEQKQKKIASMETEINQLKQVFFMLDSIHEKYKSDWEIFENETPSKGAREKAINKWQDKWDGNVEEFITQIKDRGSLLKSQELETESIIELGTNWLRDFSLAKRDEFIEVKSHLPLTKNSDENSEEKKCCKELEKILMKEEILEKISPQTNAEDIENSLKIDQKQKTITQQTAEIARLKELEKELLKLKNTNTKAKAVVTGNLKQIEKVIEEITIDGRFERKDHDEKLSNVRKALTENMKSILKEIEELREQ